MVYKLKKQNKTNYFEVTILKFGMSKRKENQKGKFSFVQYLQINTTKFSILD